MTLRVRLVDGAEDVYQPRQWEEGSTLRRAIDYRYAIDSDALMVHELSFQQPTVYREPGGFVWGDWEQVEDKQVAYYRPAQWTSVRNTDS